MSAVTSDRSMSVASGNLLLPLYLAHLSGEWQLPERVCLGCSGAHHRENDENHVHCQEVHRRRPQAGETGR